MQLLSNLPKSTKTGKKRLGRGYGSGVGGHTVGRGQKGQKTRGKMPLWFEGGQLPLVRRTPYIKGKHRFQSIKNQPVIVSFSYLNKFEDGTLITTELLAKDLRLPEKEIRAGFKIVATGKLAKKLDVAVATSAGALKAIEALGGKKVEAK